MDLSRYNFLIVFNKPVFSYLNLTGTLYPYRPVRTEQIPLLTVFPPLWQKLLGRRGEIRWQMLVIVIACSVSAHLQTTTCDGLGWLFWIRLCLSLSEET